jgi:hypothetical protein
LRIGKIPMQKVSQISVKAGTSVLKKSDYCLLQVLIALTPLSQNIHQNTRKNEKNKIFFRFLEFPNLTKMYSTLIKKKDCYFSFS